MYVFSIYIAKCILEHMHLIFFIHFYDLFMSIYVNKIDALNR